MANEVYKALNRIKELRIEKGVTQSTVAKAIGISQGMLTNYETGKRSPRDFKVWQDLADYFEVTTSYIMGTSDFRTYQDEINEIQTSAKENYGVEVPAEIIKDYKGNPVSTTYNTLALRTEMAKKLLPELDKMISTIDSYLYSSPTIDFDDKEKADYFYSDEFKLANAQIDQLLIWKHRKKVFQLKKQLLEKQIQNPENYFALEDGITKAELKKRWQDYRRKDSNENEL